jgi:hypothetical protein
MGCVIKCIQPSGTICCSFKELQIPTKYISIFIALYENKTIISICRYYEQVFETHYDRVFCEVRTKIEHII